jgi:hypothetical protein
VAKLEGCGERRAGVIAMERVYYLPHKSLFTLYSYIRA